MKLLTSVLIITLTGPDSQPITLNVDQIVSVRPPRSKDHFAPGTQCLVSTADGKMSTVTETCAEVERRMEEGDE
jgi:hypothetical protein